MDKMYDVVAIGETLIDFTPAGTNEQGMQLFAQNPGGAPANVLAMHAKLGGSTAFIGKVGDDDFGRFLTQTLREAGVGVEGVRVDERVPTTLAFVQWDAHGDRSFSFYRKPGADVLLRADELSPALTQHCHILHFGSVSLTDEPSRTATLEAVRQARAAGALISYDPNYRPLLWAREDEALREMQAALTCADLIKVSEEELALLTGTDDLARGAAQLARHGAVLVVVTLGAQGAFYHAPQAQGQLPAFAVQTVDTTGAGDSFWGALLHCLRGKDGDTLRAMPQQAWEEIVRFAAAAGALATTQKGAIPAMPTRAQMEALLHRQP